MAWAMKSWNCSYSTLHNKWSTRRPKSLKNKNQFYHVTWLNRTKNWKKDKLIIITITISILFWLKSQYFFIKVDVIPDARLALYHHWQTFIFILTCLLVHLFIYFFLFLFIQTNSFPSSMSKVLFEILHTFWDDEIIIINSFSCRILDIKMFVRWDFGKEGKSS